MKERMLRILTAPLIFGLLLSLFESCKPKAVPDSDPVYEIIPFEFVEDIMIIKAKINGQVDARLIFDSGEGSITMSPNLVQKLNLKETNTEQLLGMAQEKYVPVYEYINVQLGSFILDSIKGGALSMDAQCQTLGTQIDGIIGYEILKNYVTEIDYEKQTIKLSKSLVTDLTPYTEKRLYISSDLPVMYNCTATFIDSFSLTGNYVLDFGANNTIIINTLVSTENNLYNRIGKTFKSGNISTTGKHQTYTGRLKAYEFSKYHFTNAPVSLGTAYSGFLGEMGYTGLLGNGFLKRFNTIYDIPSRKIYLKANKYADEDFTVNSTGISLRSNLGFDSFFVNTVYKDSPGFKAGIQRGDQLINIDGKNSFNYKLYEIKKMINQPGKTIKLGFKRNDETFEVVLNMEDII